MNGFIALCREHDECLDLLSYHCIIHQQDLISKRLNAKSVMDVALKIVNSIRGKSLRRRFSNLTLEEGILDIILYTDVRRLSRYTFLEIFCSLLSKMNNFEGEGR
jgi:hypothetical protein